MDHITQEEMDAFLGLRLPREETRRIVRHLLSRCPDCAALAQSHPVWSVGGEPSLRRPGEILAAISLAIGRSLRRYEDKGTLEDV
jgi:hypothetical protein